eukprot:10858191-Alexandrium_andersonii.AAC.1
MLQIRAPEVPRETRRLRHSALEFWGFGFRRFRAAETAAWPSGRVVTTASSGWVGGRQVKVCRRVW